MPHEIGIFVEPWSFPDLAQGKADINKKNLRVEVNDATLEEEAKIHEEMYVFCTNYVTNDNDLSFHYLA